MARAAAVEDAGADAVGEHLGAEAEAERVVTHYFASTALAYRGWRWAVTVARASRARNVTVSEVVLLPGGEAILPPEWVPWSERLRPGDLGVGDLLPTDADDLRLVPAYAHAYPEDDVDVALWWELGLGRVRVLGPEGRDEAVERWYDGDRGPHAEIAVAAPAQCLTCGFLLPLAGSLRGLLGICANAYAPDDGRVVTYDHGCGAHSEVAVVPAQASDKPHVIDEMGYDDVVESPPAHEPGSVEDEAPSEDLGHS